MRIGGNEREKLGEKAITGEEAIKGHGKPVVFAIRKMAEATSTVNFR